MKPEEVIALSVLVSSLSICFTVIFVVIINRRCQHVFEQTDKFLLMGSSKKIPEGVRYLYTCQKCGITKTRSV